MCDVTDPSLETFGPPDSVVYRELDSTKTQLTACDGHAIELLIGCLALSSSLSSSLSITKTGGPRRLLQQLIDTSNLRKSCDLNQPRSLITLFSHADTWDRGPGTVGITKPSSKRSRRRVAGNGSESQEAQENDLRSENRRAGARNIRHSLVNLRRTTRSAQGATQPDTDEAESEAAVPRRTKK
jgi:hypothetical protein